MQRQGDGPQQHQRQCDATPGLGQAGGLPGQQQAGEADQRSEGAEAPQPEGGQQGDPQQDQAGSRLAGQAEQHGQRQHSPDQGIG
ncbi:hypothetical protein D3C76_1671780 [compost metagenome]